MGKNRRSRGDGCIIKRDNGTYEGTYRVHKKDGTTIRKSFVRNKQQEISDIIARLKVLEPIDNDIVKIDICKETNEISLISKFGQSSSISTNKINLNTTVDKYVDYWLWNHRRRGERGTRIKDTTFQDYVGKAQLIKNKMGSVTLEDGSVVDVKVSELTFEFIEQKLLEIFDETCNNTAKQIKNHVKNMMHYAKKDGAIRVNPLAEEKINFPDRCDNFRRKIIQESDVQAVIDYCLRNWYIDVLTQVFTRCKSVGN